MKFNHKKIKTTAALLALILAASAITGCAGNTDKTPENTTQSNPSPDIDQTLPDGYNPAEGYDPVQGEGNGGDNAVQFKPSEMGMLPQEKYEFPYMGLTAALTDTLLANMDSTDVTLLNDEAHNSDGTLKYATLSWYALTEEQKNLVVSALDPEAWRASLAAIGTLGVYHADVLNELDAITGCTEHKDLGKSADGTYSYYLSFADGADESLRQELEQTNVTLIDMLALDPSSGKTAFSKARVETSELGDFTAEDVDGTQYTQELFTNYELTLVNAFPTWCTPCIEEMPALEELKQAMAEFGVNVVTVALDTVNEVGETDQAAVEMAKLLREKAGLTFPILKPDATEMNGRLTGIDSFPETFFVDRDGNIVGETYSGTHTFEGWKEIVLNELAKLEGAKQ